MATDAAYYRRMVPILAILADKDADCNLVAGTRPVLLKVSLAEEVIAIELPQWVNQQPNHLQTVTEAAVNVLRAAAARDRGGIDEMTNGSRPSKVARFDRGVQAWTAACSSQPNSGSHEPLWVGMDLVSPSQSSEALVLIQPRVTAQWHPNACGYHALYNARLLLTAADALSAGERVSPQALSR